MSLIACSSFIVNHSRYHQGLLYVTEALLSQTVAYEINLRVRQNYEGRPVWPRSNVTVCTKKLSLIWGSYRTGLPSFWVHLVIKVP